MSALMTRFDPRTLRAAFGRYPTGVAIMTTGSAAGPVGMTANSFTSVSLDPPLILWCLSRQAPSAHHFLTAQRFAVNVLSSAQAGLSQQFARPAADKFAQVSWSPGPSRVPLLDGVVARFVCRGRGGYEAGDHVILIGEVEDFQDFDGDPLVFHSGSYGQVS